MVCRLCQRDKTLIKSHIIPKFYWEPLRDDIGGIIRIDNSHEEQRIRYPKSGEYEKLLCFDCDNKEIGKLDDYVSDLFNNKSVLGFESREKKIVFPIIYKKLKLFLLSVLWRSSVASRFFWSNVNLGEETNERLRKFILNKSKVNKYTYPCICLKFSDPKVKNPYFILSPLHIKNKETEYYIYIFAGFMWVFFPTKKDYLNFGDYPLIKDEDKLVIPKVNLEEMTFLPEGHL